MAIPAKKVAAATGGSTKQIALTVDEEAQELIDGLKADLGATTSSAVLRKALAIARLAADQAKESKGIVLLRGREQSAEEGILVSLKT
jgi:hypothetical protein